MKSVFFLKQTQLYFVLFRQQRYEYRFWCPKRATKHLIKKTFTEALKKLNTNWSMNFRKLRINCFENSKTNSYSFKQKNTKHRACKGSSTNWRSKFTASYTKSISPSHQSTRGEWLGQVYLPTKPKGDDPGPWRSTFVLWLLNFERRFLTSL